jgi:hypothetical protein
MLSASVATWPTWKLPGCQLVESCISRHNRREFGVPDGLCLQVAGQFAEENYDTSQATHPVKAERSAQAGAA